MLAKPLVVPTKSAEMWWSPRGAHRVLQIGPEGVEQLVLGLYDGDGKKLITYPRAEARDQVHFPRPSDAKRLVAFDWTPIRYRNVITVLKNPFYAVVHAYGKTERHTEIVDGRPRKSPGHSRPVEEWEVMLKDHHEGYIDWAEFEQNQKQLAANTYGKVGVAKSGRGGT